MSILSDVWRHVVRFGFRLLYNELAFTYDAVSWVVSMGAWRCWQQQSIPYLPLPDAGRLLELAHGTGNLQLDLHAAGYDTIAYDLSPKMGRIASAKLQRNGIMPKLVRGKAQQLPFSDESFASVVSTFPSDFILHADTLREVHRILHPEGVMVIVPNGTFTGSGIVKSFLEWLYRITGQRENTGRDIVDYFAGFGFAVSVYMEPCSNSVAQVVVLKKQ